MEERGEQDEGKMDGLNFPPITSRTPAKALIDEVFKSPISHHRPLHKWLLKGRDGRSGRRARLGHKM